MPPPPYGIECFVYLSPHKLHSPLLLSLAQYCWLVFFDFATQRMRRRASIVFVTFAAFQNSPIGFSPFLRPFPHVISYNGAFDGAYLPDVSGFLVDVFLVGYFCGLRSRVSKRCLFLKLVPGWGERIFSLKFFLGRG